MCVFDRIFFSHQFMVICFRIFHPCGDYPVSGSLCALEHGDALKLQRKIGNMINQRMEGATGAIWASMASAPWGIWSIHTSPNLGRGRS